MSIILESFGGATYRVACENCRREYKTHASMWTLISRKRCAACIPASSPKRAGYWKAYRANKALRGECDRCHEHALPDRSRCRACLDIDAQRKRDRKAAVLGVAS
jgi:hypothetical protein